MLFKNHKVIIVNQLQRIPAQMLRRDSNLSKLSRKVFAQSILCVIEGKVFENKFKNPAYSPACGRLQKPYESSIKQLGPHVIVYPYTAITSRTLYCFCCKKRMCIDCDSRTSPTDQPCVSEEIRARDARLSARKGAAKVDMTICEVISRNKYRDR